MKCARELGIKPVSDMLDKMGISDEDIDRMDSEMESMMELAEMSDDGTEGDQGKTPPVDFAKQNPFAARRKYAYVPSGHPKFCEFRREGRDPPRLVINLPYFRRSWCLLSARQQNRYPERPWRSVPW